MIYKLKSFKYDDERLKNVNVNIQNFQHSVDNMEDDNEDDWEPYPYCLKMNDVIGTTNKNIKII